MVEDEPLLSPDDVARRLQCSRRTAYRVMNDIGVIRIGRIIRVEKSRFLCYLEQCKERPWTEESQNVAQRIQRISARSESVGSHLKQKIEESQKPSSVTPSWLRPRVKVEPQDSEDAV